MGFFLFRYDEDTFKKNTQLFQRFTRGSALFLQKTKVFFQDSDKHYEKNCIKLGKPRGVKCFEVNIQSKENSMGDFGGFRFTGDDSL